jgi:hypothetical protein
MLLLRNPITLVLVLLAQIIQAADTPLPPEVQLKLETLKSGFESYSLKMVQHPYEEGVNALNAKVKPALEQESRAAAQRKDLDGLVRAKSDLERIGQGQVLTAADAPPPAGLKQVYATYKQEMNKLEAAKKVSLADALQRYDKGLSALQDELTTQQNIAAALHVKQLRTELASGADAPQPAAGKADPSKLVTAPALPPQAELEPLLVGSWVFTTGSLNMEKTLLKDGSVISIGYSLPGKWKILGTKLRIDYINDAWAEFELPPRDGGMKGRSFKNEDIRAEKQMEAATDLAPRLNSTQWTWGMYLEGSLSRLKFVSGKNLQVNDDRLHPWWQFEALKIKWDDGTVITFADDLQTFEAKMPDSTLRRGKRLAEATK